MKINWKGRARRVATTTEDGKQQVIFVEPGGTYDVPDNAKLAGEGVNWEKATKAKEK